MIIVNPSIQALAGVLPWGSTFWQIYLAFKK